MKASTREAQETSRLGAAYLGGDKTSFTLWAPAARSVDVHILGPREQLIPLSTAEQGHWRAVVEDIPPGSLYKYRLDGNKEYPDPASKSQPQGVHGPSQVLNPSFEWSDAEWRGIPLERFVIYELHVGAFTSEGTFQAVIPHLSALKDLGVTAIELMPVAQFPGERNWGYDGVLPFAVQHSYGGAQSLKTLVDACHRNGLAVVLDVVYNHLGPEGNYLAEFGPYFSKAYKTPWGGALNFDGYDSDSVRRYFIENALYWLDEFHFDALRLDAVQAIVDTTSFTFLEELSREVDRWRSSQDRRVSLIAESSSNDPRLVSPRKAGGIGMDAVWCDDFHDALHSLLTGERQGYYQDFGGLEDLASAYRHGLVLMGQYSHYRRRRHGRPADNVPFSRFVVFAQNHDQIGNRLKGERLSSLVDFESLKLAAGAYILSPFIPMIFMGEEYGESAPFFYFTSHSDPDLVEAVRKGRKEDFAAFQWKTDPPDPQAVDTFIASKLNHGLASDSSHGALRSFYQELLRLRKESPFLTGLAREDLEVFADQDTNSLLMLYKHPGQCGALVLHFGDENARVSLPLPAGTWRKLVDSAEGTWKGSGSNIPRTLKSGGGIVLSLTRRSMVMLTAEAG